MGLAKIDEEDNHGYKSTKFEYMIMNAAEAVDFENQEQLSRIDELTKSIEAADEKLAALALERNNLALDLERTINDVIGWSHTYADILERAWNLAGFKSTIVKRAVMKVRQLFFDEVDNKTAFSKYHFCNLKIDHGYDCSGEYLKFIFAKDNDSNTAFSISIPIAGTCKWSWKNSYITGKYYFEKLLGGRYGSFSIMDSYKLEDIRNAVTAYVVEEKMTPQRYKSKLHKGREKVVNILLGDNKDDSFRKKVNFTYYLNS